MTFALCPNHIPSHCPSPHDTHPPLARPSDVCNDITTNTTAYFPSNDSHVVLPEAPHPRYRHAAAAVGDKIFVYGGCDVTDALVTAVDVFDVPTRSWSTLPNAFSQATSDNAGFVLGTKIYSVGG